MRLAHQYFLVANAIEAESQRNLGPGLQNGLPKVDRSSVHTGRRAGLEPPHFEAVCGQVFRKSFGRCLARPTGRIARISHDNSAVEERARRKDHRSRSEFVAVARNHAVHMPAACVAPTRGPPYQTRNRRLLHFEPGLAFQYGLHGDPVKTFVALRPERLDGRTLAGVQLPDLDEGSISDAPHFPTQSVDLAHQMPLGRPPDRRIAGHPRNNFRIHRQQ